MGVKFNFAIAAHFVPKFCESAVALLLRIPADRGCYLNARAQKMTSEHPVFVVLKVMREQELAHLKPGGAFSRAYLDVRHTYVDHVWEIMEGYQSAQRTIHLAIRDGQLCVLTGISAAAFRTVALTSVAIACIYACNNPFRHLTY